MSTITKRLQARSVEEVGPFCPVPHKRRLETSIHHWLRCYGNPVGRTHHWRPPGPRPLGPGARTAPVTVQKGRESVSRLINHKVSHKVNRADFCWMLNRMCVSVWVVGEEILKYSP